MALAWADLSRFPCDTRPDLPTYPPSRFTCRPGRAAPLGAPDGRGCFLVLGAPPQHDLAGLVLALLDGGSVELPVRMGDVLGLGVAVGVAVRVVDVAVPQPARDGVGAEA